MVIKPIRILLILAMLSACAMADHIKVDLDGRSDATAAGFSSWLATDGTNKTFGTVDVHLTTPNLPSYTSWKIGWYNKDGLNKYELAMDGLWANYDDGSVSRPSYNGGTILMQIDGLAAGTHTIITYHNAIWPVSKYNRTICDVNIYVNNVYKFTVTPSQYATNDANVVHTFFTVEANEGQPVYIRMQPVLEDPCTYINTAILNGFEIDNPASIDDYAIDPNPGNGNEHLFANNDDPTPGSAAAGYYTLSWTPSGQANYQDVYFGTSLADVNDANVLTSGIYKGRQVAADANWNATNLDSKYTYYWRVDTVKSDSTIVKGYLWKFRTRHLAFATAEGYGRFARGGRFGRVIEVNTLEDYNLPGGETAIPGSLRYATEVEKGPRVVVFKVGGNINLKRRITIPNNGGDIYVAGQTAPGEGICVTRYGFGTLGSSDVVMRFIRNRVGDYCQKAMDGIGLASSDYCMVDHCTISWTIDEGHSSRSAKNISFQRNIISEALNDSYHYDDSDPCHLGTQPHGFAASISGNIGSYHHNLLAHCTARNWSLAGGLESDGHHYAGYDDIRNNVVYNWQSKTTDGGCRKVNFVNNYYKPGPVGGVTWLMRPDGDELGLGEFQQFYIVGNRLLGTLNDPNSDNWDYVQPQHGTEAQLRVDTPFFPSYVTTQTANESYLNVLDDVGATRPVRDSIDARIVSEVLNGSYTYSGSKTGLPGIIDSQEDIGGYKEYANGPAPEDSDHDGLPDWWETAHSLDPNSAIGDFNDANGDTNADGYTNMDDWLEYLAGGGTQFEDYTCTGYIISDLDVNCKVDFLDYAEFAERWLNQSEDADINNDTNIDYLDLQQVATDWLKCNRIPAGACEE